jgi:hypothetical protein
MNKTLETPPPGLPVLDLAAISRASRNGATEPANPATLPLPLDEVRAASDEVIPPPGLPIVGTVERIEANARAQQVMDGANQSPDHDHLARLAALGREIDKVNPPIRTSRRVLGSLATHFS